MKTVVFVGPSLAGEIPDSTAELDVRAPAQQGDVLGAAVEGAERIVLIDGYFGQHLSVWHKEILEALRMGVDVVGAASMGALRALECEAYGMRGTGRVFAMYKQGLIANDDEVALSHAGAEHGWLNLSMPLVNVRMTVAMAVRDGRVTHDEGAAVVAGMAKIFYADRGDWIQACGGDVAKTLRENPVDVKRADAREAIKDALSFGQNLRNFGNLENASMPRNHVLWDEDRMVTISGDERVRVRSLDFGPVVDEMGFLRAAALRFAEELGIERPRHDDATAQAAADDFALDQLATWLASTGFRSERARQRVFAAAKVQRG